MLRLFLLYGLSWHGLIPVGLETADKITLLGINDGMLLLEIRNDVVWTGNSQTLKCFEITIISGSIARPPQIGPAIRFGCQGLPLRIYLVKIEDEWVIGRKPKAILKEKPGAQEKKIKGDIHLFEEKGSIQGQQPAPAMVINRLWPTVKTISLCPPRRSRPRNSISRGDETEFRGVLKQTLVYEAGGGVGEVLAEEF